MTGPPTDDETVAGTTRSTRSACLRYDARPGAVPTAEFDCRAKPLDRATGPAFEPPPESVSNPPHSSAALFVWACRPGGQMGVADASSSAPSQVLSWPPIDSRHGSASTADIPVSDQSPPASWPKGLSLSRQSPSTHAAVVAAQSPAGVPRAPQSPLGPNVNAMMRLPSVSSWLV